MTDRRIIICENGRTVTRGVRQIAESAFEAYQREADNLKYTLDYEPWLDGGTISTVTRTLSGLTATSTSANTLTATQKLQGTGYMEIAVLDSNGNTRTDRLNIYPRLDECFSADYD